MLVAGLVASAAACTQQKDSPGAGAPFVQPEERRGTLGETETLADVDVNVLLIESFEQSVNHFPRLKLTVRSENSSSRMLRNPDMELWCDEAEEGGEWFLGSTWEANGLLPGGGGVSEGEIFLGFPPKPDAERYPVATCTNARVKMIATNEADRSQEVVVYPVSSAIIKEAIDAPVGRAMPLPQRGT